MIKPSKQLGFNLLELLIALFILAIVTISSVTTWQAWVENNQQQMAINRLQNSLWLARSKAITTRQVVVICAGKDIHNCHIENKWETGWLIKDANKQQIIWQEDAIAQHLRLKWNGFNKQIIFYPDGSTSISNGQFVLCRQKTAVYVATINRQGRIQQMPTPTHTGC